MFLRTELCKSSHPRVNFFIGSWWKTNQSTIKAVVSVSEGKGREAKVDLGGRWCAFQVCLHQNLSWNRGPASYRLTAQPRGGDWGALFLPSLLGVCVVPLTDCVPCDCGVTVVVLSWFVFYLCVCVCVSDFFSLCEDVECLFVLPTSGCCENRTRQGRWNLIALWTHCTRQQGSLETFLGYLHQVSLSPFCHEACSQLEQQRGSRIPLPHTAVVLWASSLYSQVPLVSLPSRVHDLRWQFSQCHDKGNSSSLGEFSRGAHPQSLPRCGRALEGGCGPELCFVKRICRDSDLSCIFRIRLQCLETLT